MKTINLQAVHNDLTGFHAVQKQKTIITTKNNTSYTIVSQGKLFNSFYSHTIKTPKWAKTS